jgi:hypothetical protein
MTISAASFLATENPNSPLPVSRFLKHPLTPLILLLTVTLTVGFFTFRDYGLSWDEPLFYDYADSIRLAYTPQAFSPGFDFNQVYGPSPEDHKFYGPAYLLMARPIQQAVMSIFKADRASAWHLVNFLTFQIGLIFFFFLLRRWLSPWPATLSTAFFVFQPVFWGHAFINPKDMPFMIFFIASITLGLEMVDRMHSPTPLGSGVRGSPTQRGEGKIPLWGLVLLAGFILGCTSAIRILGPLAGGFVFVYFLYMQFMESRDLPLENWRQAARLQTMLTFLVYALITILTMFAAWPYLWADPFNRFLEVLRHMSNNPTQLAVLFMGQIFPADALPHRYFPQLLGLTLTEPTWILFFTGLIVAIRSFLQKKQGWLLPTLIFAWFGLMFVYAVAVVPPMYDGYRHFLFILPPVFVFCGFAIQWIWNIRSDDLSRYTRAFAFLLLLPGLLGILRTHPYEYTFYNAFAGNVYRTYETDYWLTCYKEAVEWTRANAPQKTLHIQREFPIAAYYGQGLVLKNLGLEAESDIQPGDWLLFSTRANLDVKSIYRKLPVIHSFGRNGAEFCIIKQK